MDITTIKKEFPLLAEHPEFIYFDNASTTQKPKVVLDRLQKFLTEEN
jgi:cysteine desulfurase / selenocysteine lyase